MPHKNFSSVIKKFCPPNPTNFCARFEQHAKREHIVRDWRMQGAGQKEKSMIPLLQIKKPALESKYLQSCLQLSQYLPEMDIILFMES